MIEFKYKGKYCKIIEYIGGPLDLRKIELINTGGELIVLLSELEIIDSSPPPYGDAGSEL
jgi:hypothetical protein